MHLANDQPPPTWLDQSYHRSYLYPFDDSQHRSDTQDVKEMSVRAFSPRTRECYHFRITPPYLRDATRTRIVISYSARVDDASGCSPCLTELRSANTGVIVFCNETPFLQVWLIDSSFEKKIPLQCVTLPRKLRRSPSRRVQSPQCLSRTIDSLLSQPTLDVS